MSRHRSTARRYSVLAVGLLVVVLFSGVAVADPVDLDPDTNLDGEGTEAQPYNITNASELQAMRGNLTAHYELGKTIDASNTSEWYGGDGLYPIGNSTNTALNGFAGNKFEGSFDGNGFEIQNLAINRSDESYIGLFGFATTSSKIGNVTLFNVSVNGTAHVGALVGESHGEVYDAHASGDVRSDHAEAGTGGPSPPDGEGSRTGALVGMLADSGTVANATASANVTGVSGREKRLGGLIGFSDGTITDSTASGDVHGNGGVGGLVGRNAANGYIENASATGNVSGQKYNTDDAGALGGLAGFNSGTITESYATGNVSDDGTGNLIGGLIGSNSETVTRSYTTGTVDGTSNVGGLAGKNSGTVRDSYATGTVIGGTPVGGLVGDNQGPIEQSYAVVDVPDGEAGFVGSDNGGSVTAGYWDEAATGETDTADGKGLSTFEMTALVAKDYMDLGFEGTWNATDRYPRLAWEGVDEPDPYPTAAPSEGEVWLLNDSENGYYHNYSIHDGQVRWLGEIVAIPGPANSAQLIEIAAGNATEDYDTAVVGPGEYRLNDQQTNLTASAGANLTRLFSYSGSEQTEIVRIALADFDSYETASFRIDNPEASTLAIGDNGSFATNGDGGFYIESDTNSAQDSPLVGVYDAADRFNLTIRNIDFGMETDTGDTILLNDSKTAFTVDLDVRSHAGAVINASEASTLRIHNSTITESDNPRGAGLTDAGISFLTLDAGGLADVTIANVTVDGATEDTAVDGVVDILDLDPDASVTIDDLRIDSASQDAISVAADFTSLVASKLNLTDIDGHGFSIGANVDSVTVADSELTTTNRKLTAANDGSIYSNAVVSQFNVTNTSITDSGANGIYLRGTIGNATIDDNKISNTANVAIDLDVDAVPSTPFEISNNTIIESLNSHIYIGADTQSNTTDNRLFDSGNTGVYLDAADSVIANNTVESTDDLFGIELGTSATNTSMIGTTVIDSSDSGIYIDASDVTIRNTTVDTTGEYGIEFDVTADNGELIESTVRNTSDYELAVVDVTVAVTDLDLWSGTVSADVTDNSLNASAPVVNGPEDYQSGDDAVRIASPNGDVDNLTLSYNTSAFSIDQRALNLWQQVGPNWNSKDSTVDTNEQVVMTTEAIDTAGIVTTFASNVSITANDTTVDEGENGTIELNATNGADGLENVELEIDNDGGLDGIDVGETVTTDANGEANVSFQEDTAGTYIVEFDWTNNTVFGDSATVTVESAGGGGGGGGGTTGGGSSGGGGASPAPSIEQMIVDDGTTDVTGGRSGDTVAINDETLRRSGSVDGLNNIAVDGLSIELANDRDFWIDVETYERGEERAVDSAADSDDGGGDIEDDESTDPTESSITASFEAETETVSVGYVTVTHNLEPEDIADVTFDFSVRDSYLDELDVDPEDVNLYRQTDQWGSLSTDYRELSGGRYRFEANSPGFSSFAIGTNAPLYIVVNGSLDRTRIRDGETATALATVNNRGQNAVTHTVNLTADGEMVATETVSIDGGAVTEVPLAFEPAAGSYEMAVDDVSLGSLTVVAEESQPLWWLLVVAIPILLLVMWYRRQENDGGENNEDDEDDK